MQSLQILIARALDGDTRGPRQKLKELHIRVALKS